MTRAPHLRSVCEAHGVQAQRYSARGVRTSALLRMRWRWAVILLSAFGVLMRAGRFASVVLGTSALLVAFHHSALVHLMHVLAHMRAGAES